MVVLSLFSFFFLWGSELKSQPNRTAILTRSEEAVQKEYAFGWYGSKNSDPGLILHAQMRTDSRRSGLITAAVKRNRLSQRDKVRGKDARIRRDE